MSLMEEFQNTENDLGIIPLNDRVLRFQGKDTQKFLQGILSNDIRLLKEGMILPACFLTAKGKWIAALQLFQIGNSIFAKTSPLEAKNLLQAIQPLIMFSDCEVSDMSEDYQWILGLGKNALSWIDTKPPLPFFPDDEYRLPAFLILCPRKNTKTWMDKWNRTPISPNTLETLRIESGLPLFGKDVDDKMIPLEANLDRYFSYTKGCYVGQETISRIKHYGRVNKKLVKLKFDKGSCEVDLPVLFQDKEVGKISSLCYSPHYGANIALAILGQEANTPGTQVSIQTPNEIVSAQVVE